MGKWLETEKSFVSNSLFEKKKRNEFVFDERIRLLANEIRGFNDGKLLHLIDLINSILPMLKKEIECSPLLHKRTFLETCCHVRSFVSTSHPLWLDRRNKGEEGRRGESVHPTTAGQFQQWIFIVLMNYFIRYSTFREFWIKESFVSSAATNTRFVSVCNELHTVYTMFEYC